MVPFVAVLTGFDGKIYNIMIETHDTIKLGKIGGGGRGITRKERGLLLCCPSPDYRRLNMYEFHILKSFY